MIKQEGNDTCTWYITMTITEVQEKRISRHNFSIFTQCYLQT